MVFPWISYLEKVIGISCEESQFEILQAAANVSNGDTPLLINTKGAEKLYIIRDVRQVFPTSNVSNSLVSGNVQNLGNSIDKDLNTFSNYNGGASTTNGLVLYDFGSINNRNPAASGRISGNTNGTLRMRWSTDNATWSAWETVSFGSNTPQVTVAPFGVVSMRYVQLEFFGNAVGGTQVNAYEVFDINEGYGGSNFRLEVKDIERNIWHTIPDNPNFTTLFTTSETTVIDTILPYTTTNFRGVIDNTGLVNISVIIVKVKPCAP